MIGLYRQGTSPLHRMPAGPKILLLMAVALAITLTVTLDTLWLLAAAAALVVAGYLVAALGIRELGRQVWVVRWIVAIMLVTQLVFLPWTTALLNVGRVVVVLVLAALVTLTTRIADLLDATERGLRPLERIGVNPRRVGLLLAMTITTIPVIAGFARAIREAQRARGGRLRVWSMAVPLLVLSLKHSDDLADALIARGVE
ncbi:energy-coupling factor transporter transmembrane component T family protein [Rathayibacter soli]|uniref:energy-coupling factor transporter transmembrane component T family protein n=1 Tax=Rathayibacter soli TaxID=3144168 RepID=UPI0027E408EC|nr:energy-coupling factor transporter transmembrane protein EcfT [Glaciibacter superstes]